MAQMSRIIECWRLAETRAKHLCAFETLGLNIRCRKPSQPEVRKAWHRLCMRLHPDKNSATNELATEATRCINLAKQHLFEDFYGDAAARVAYKHREKQADVIVVDDPNAGASTPAADKRPMPDAPAPEKEMTKRQRASTEQE